MSKSANPMNDRERLIGEVSRRFKTFGGDRAAGGNPIAAATEGEPPIFALGVDVGEVVDFIAAALQPPERDPDGFIRRRDLTADGRPRPGTMVFEFDDAEDDRLPFFTCEPGSPPPEKPGEPCTGVTAEWCPVCGACTCDRESRHLEDHNCPLHGPESNHAAPPEKVEREMEPSVKGLQAWAEWFDDPKNARVNFSAAAGLSFSAGFVLRYLAKGLAVASPPQKEEGDE